MFHKALLKQGLFVLNTISTNSYRAAMDLGNLRIHVDHALKTWPTSLDLSHNHTHTRCVLISAMSQASRVSNTGRSKILIKNIHHNF